MHERMNSEALCGQKSLKDENVLHLSALIDIVAGHLPRYWACTFCLGCLLKLGNWWNWYESHQVWDRLEEDSDVWSAAWVSVVTAELLTSMPSIGPEISFCIEQLDMNDRDDWLYWRLRYASESAIVTFMRPWIIVEMWMSSCGSVFEKLKNELAKYGSLHADFALHEDLFE